MASVQRRAGSLRGLRGNRIRSGGHCGIVGKDRLLPRCNQRQEIGSGSPFEKLSLGCDLADPHEIGYPLEDRIGSPIESPPDLGFLAQMQRKETIGTSTTSTGA